MKRICIALLSETVDLRAVAQAFERAGPEIDLRSGNQLGRLEDINVALCWYAPKGLLARLPRLQLVQSLAAGIDHLTDDPQLPHDVPLCRVVDATMAAGMNAYVAWAVIHRQRHMPAYAADAAQGRWRQQPIVSPGRHRVGILGLGRLGRACATALVAIGYPVRGFSNSSKNELPAGVTGFHGADQLNEFLSGCDTLVNLLPLTPATRGCLNAALYAQLPRGAHLINVGRGAHLVEADLIPALNSGQLGAATLDALPLEPLPAEHPFWRHPQIVVTPHIATRTPSKVIVEQTLANLAALRDGRRPEGQVDLDRGY